MIFLQFEGYYKVIAYDPRNFEASLLGERIEETIRGEDLIISDRYLIVTRDGQRNFLENTFSPKYLPVPPGGPKDEESIFDGIFSLETL